MSDCTNKVKDTLAVYLKADTRILGRAGRVECGTGLHCGAAQERTLISHLCAYRMCKLVHDQGRVWQLRFLRMVSAVGAV